MRALILSNMYPTVRSPGRGIFITSRLAAHRQAGDHFTAVALRPSFGQAIDSGLALVSRRSNALTDTEFTDIPVRMSPLDAVRLSKGRYPSDRLLTRAAFAIVREVRSQRVDVVHGHGMYLVPAGSIAQHVGNILGVPYVVTAHGSDIVDYMPKRRNRYIDVLDGAASVAYVSDALRRRAVDLGASGRRAITLPNGVDTSLFRPTKEAEVRVTASPPLVAYIGNLVEVKGADLLPGVFRGILHRMPNCTFAVVGDGPLRRELEEACRGLAVRFEGAVAPERVVDVMREARLVLLPSRSEGWPCVVLEAHATETPILASDAGGTAEAVGDPQFIVPHGPAFQERFIVTAVKILCGEILPKQLRRRSLHFDWRSVAKWETEMLEAAVLRWRSAPRHR